MADTSPKSRPLSVPRATSVRYKRNFIKTCVCELRFPHLLELESKQPVEIQRELRKEYPRYEAQHSLEVGSSPEVKRENRYVFNTKKADWSISLRAFSLALETKKYKDFDDFTERLAFMMEKCLPYLDTDFFTRVGLRYINAVPIQDGDFRGWLNSDLDRPLMEGTFGTVTQYQTQVRGSTEHGFYTFRHGVDPESVEDDLKYMLDYDYSAENVSADDALNLVKTFNEINYSFFMWSLGQKSKDWLGEGVPKK